MANKQDEYPQDANAMDRGDRNAPSSHAESSHSGGGLFEIRVRGHLSSQWADWLEGLEMKLLDNGEMILVGTIVDQAALMGILSKVNRLNLTLLSVIEVNQTNRHNHP
jgi:hypothetical protein